MPLMHGPSTHRYEAFARIVLAAGVVVQLVVTFDRYLVPWGKAIWEVRTLPALERSGRLTAWLGDDYTDFMGFLRVTTAEKATIVFPEDGGGYEKPWLQYFLFPRHIVICAEDRFEECVVATGDPLVYVAVVNGLPSDHMVPDSAAFFPYRADSGSGVYELDLVETYARLYPPGSYASVEGDPRRIGRRLRALCAQHGIRDRIPRPIVPGDKRAVNKRLAEQLANTAYTLELEEAQASRVWAYRKAAWAMDDLEQDVGLIYRTLGRKGLQSIEGVGSALAGEIESLLASEAAPGG